SPLRSPITGGGYEILVETTMPDSDTNRAKLAQFVAQEIAVDKRIPPASRDAVGVVVEEARRRAKTLDNKDKALSLRLRELGGLIRSVGYIADTSSSIWRMPRIPQTWTNAFMSWLPIPRFRKPDVTANIRMRAWPSALITAARKPTG